MDLIVKVSFNIPDLYIPRVILIIPAVLGSIGAFGNVYVKKLQLVDISFFVMVIGALLKFVQIWFE